MKRFLSILSLVVFGFASMSCYDDSELWETVEDLDGRVQTLEDLCTKLNTNLTALSTLVQSMEKGDYVVSVSPLKEGSVEVGYRIVFKENGPVDIYHGQDGADGKDGQDGTDGKDGQNGTDGENGADGKTPEFGPKKDMDELYYWAVDGEFVLDAEGKKIPLVTVGATPQLKIEDETWFVSYDDGNEWEELGAAVSVGIKEIEEVDGELVITMADGSQIAVPLGSPMKVVLGEFDAATLQYGNDLVIPYTIEGVEGEAVVFLLKEGEGFVVELVEETATSGKVTVSQQEAAETEKKLKVGIFAVGEDGTTVSQAVRLVSGVFYSVEGNKETYDVEAAGGKVEFTVATNAAFEVKTGAEWITYAQTKAVEEKVLGFDVAANEGEAREAAVEIVSGDITLGFTVAQAGGYVPAPEESLVGAYKIQKFWVYGGTGPAYGGAGWVDLHNKTWWFDEATGHGIKAELDNYLEFTLTEFNADGTQSTGKCVNWAGANGKNWDTWFYNNKKADGADRNPDAPKDGSNFYRQIPIGESTWVRDYTVTPNTVTFTDADGRTTVLELLEPGYEFTTDKYGDSNAAANKRVFPRTEGDDLTFHAKLTGWKEVWPARYNELDKIFDCPRDFFIDVDKVDEVPAESKTSEEKWVPELPEPEEPEVASTLAGTYKFRDGKTVGGKDGSITAKGLIEQYGGWDPVKASINSMKDDKFTFTATGTDANGNETGTVTFDKGAD
ncbi:MAG: hypothetical protein E7116_00445, partial [Bacteroidales bacterium]|nr:hypothetical protein [Bacteroidales bacterium]